jgi:hypothetical protein
MYPWYLFKRQIKTGEEEDGVMPGVVGEEAGK